MALGPTLVDGGHYTLLPLGYTGERVALPDGTSWVAGTTPGTRASWAEAVAQVVARRGRGEPARLALMVGDLALPPGSRPRGGPWAIPPSYLVALGDLDPEDVVVLGEAFCRNQGKRRLLDPVRDRGAPPERTYEQQGWALLADGSGLRLVSDASLDFDGDLRVVALTRGSAPLCPLVFAGLTRWAFRSGYTAHVAVYALCDDPHIDIKLRAGATAAAQLLGGAIGPQAHRIAWSEGQSFVEDRFDPADLVGPGQRDWIEFYELARRAHPGLCRIEEATWSPPSATLKACGTSGSPSSPCSG